MCTRCGIFIVDWEVRGAPKHLILRPGLFYSPLEDRGVLPVSKVCVSGSGSKCLVNSVPGSLGCFFGFEEI